MTLLKTKNTGMSSVEDQPEELKKGVSEPKPVAAKIERISDEFWREINDSFETSEFPIWRMWR